MRYEVIRPSGDSEGLLADEWEIDPSGALLFWDREGITLKSFVIAYANGAWASFFGDES